MNTAPDMFAAGLQMLAALAVVLVVILLLLKGLKKFGNPRLGSAGANRIRVLERRYLGAKKSVCLVSVPGKVLVLGVSSDRINLLDTVDPSDARILSRVRLKALSEAWLPIA